MSEVDVALRIFGVAIVTLPLLLAAVNYLLMGEEGFTEPHPEGSRYYPLLILLTYSTLLGAVTASGTVLTGETGRAGSAAVYLMMGFAGFIGVAINTSLKYAQDSEGERIFMHRLLLILWVISVTFIGLALYNTILVVT